MSFDTREISIDDASAIEYLLFTRGVQAWRYTSELSDVSFQGSTFKAMSGISRGTIEQSNEDTSAQLLITLPRVASIASQFIGVQIPQPIDITLYRNHRGESDGEAATIWVGEVTSARFVGSNLELLCSTIMASFDNPLGRILFSRDCQNMLYDDLCRVDPLDHEYDAEVTVIDVTGTLVTVIASGTPSVPDLGSTPSHYARGWLEWNGIRSTIREETAAGEFVLQIPLPGIVVTDTVKIRRGCDRTHGMCNSVFNNGDRFQGYELIPLRDVNKRII